MAPPPPPAGAAASPWAFGETENQRAVLLARGVAATEVTEAAAGSTPGAPASRGAAANAAEAWSTATTAFLSAHDRDGWYEDESPGYMAISVTALLHLADLADDARLRQLARRELDLVLARWAQLQVAGYPAGPRSRTYVQWALGDRTTPWRAWAWLLGGAGDPAHLATSDWPELALSTYEAPTPVAALLGGRRGLAPYEVRERRTIRQAQRAPLDVALWAHATPDYILGAAQAVGALRLAVSGGEEIVATLYAEGPASPDFAPVYLWSRTRNVSGERWASAAGRDLAVGAGRAVIALLGVGAPEAAGHAYLAAAWSRPVPAGASGQTLVASCGDAYLALTTDGGGWDVAPAAQRFPEYYGEGYASSWVAVPRRQPAAIALQAGRRAEDGDLAAWSRRAEASRLTRTGIRLELLPAGGGPPLVYVAGERATVGGVPLRPAGDPPLVGPFLSSPAAGVWEVEVAGERRPLRPLPPPPVRRRAPVDAGAGRRRR